MPLYIYEVVVETPAAPAGDTPQGEPAPAPTPRFTDALMDAAEAEHRRRWRELD